MVLTSSIDPQKVSNAIEGLTVAIVAILATLRIRFAKAITLGTAIGQVLENLLSPFTTKALKLGLPNNYDNWIPVSARTISDGTSERGMGSFFFSGRATDRGSVR